MPTKLLSLLLLTALLSQTASSNNAFSTALTAARSIPSLQAISTLSTTAIQYGYGAFVGATKWRATKELFGAIEELKTCVQDPEHRRFNHRPWPWSRKPPPPKTRDWSGCITGPARAAAAVYLLQQDMADWFVPGASGRKSSWGKSGRKRIMKG